LIDARRRPATRFLEKARRAGCKAGAGFAKLT